MKQQQPPMPAAAQENVANALNKTLVFIALLVTIIGIGMMITVALLPLGAVVAALGLIWLAILYISARMRA